MLATSLAQPLPFASELRPHCQDVKTTGRAEASCPDGLQVATGRGMRSRLVGGWPKSGWDGAIIGCVAR